MSNIHHHKKSVNVERRTWDVASYEQKALARQQQQQHHDISTTIDGTTTSTTSDDNKNSDTLKEEFIPAPLNALGPDGSQRAYLQARKRKVADFIDNRIGTSTMISIDDAVGSSKQNLNATEAGTNTPTTTTTKIQITDGITKSSSSNGGIGFHCHVCDCYLKDSLTYLDHINGRKHQRKLGYTMRVERSTELDVLEKLSELQKNNINSKEQQNGNDITTTNIDYDKIVQEKDIDEERRREERKQLRKERRKCRNNNDDNDHQNNNNSNDNDVVQINLNNNGDHNDKDDKDEEGPEALIDPAMAAMMGFTGFGTTGH